MGKHKPIWAEIDLHAIKHNIQRIRGILPPGTKLMTVVKANAYGHGIIPISQICQEQGVEALGVARLDEALCLRAAGIELPIIILGYLEGEYAPEVISHDIAVTIIDLETAATFSRLAREQAGNVKVHVKIDTGMGRLGFIPNEESLEAIERISRMPGIELEGILTHFAVADIADKTYTLEQVALFEAFIGELEARGVHFDLKHAANSAAAMEVPVSRYNMVRAGITLYGLQPSPDVNQEILDLIPAMRLKSRVSMVKFLEPGQSVSYGRTFRADKRTRIATIPAGYADGYSRLLSNRVWASIKGVKVPVIGNICMDQCMLDVSALDQVMTGDEVILFGTPQDQITADDLAKILGTINYEIVCKVSARVPRVYLY